MLKYAPEPVSVGGQFAVPISIQSVTAIVVCNCLTRRINVTASMTFIVGPNSGQPIFDLRQTISSAKLDGTVVPVTDIFHHNFNGDFNARLRILARNLTANTSHVLELEYEIAEPDSPNTIPLDWDLSPRGLTWDFWFTDLAPGRYLEMWFPANLVFDHHDLSIDLRLLNAQTSHTLVTNATTTTLGTHHWQLDWTSIASFDPLIYLTPSSKLVSQTTPHTMPGGTIVNIELHKLNHISTSMSTLQSFLEDRLTEFESDVGPYLHGNRFVALIWDNPSRSMEYLGATTSNFSALEHEVFHSWFARGVKPARQSDSWSDEAWTKWFADGGAVQSTPFDFSDPPTVLCYSDPWRRDTPGSAYTKGRDVYAGLADEIGINNLKTFINEIYLDYGGKGVSTEDIAAHLILRSGRIDLLDFFHHFVYGQSIPINGSDLYLKDSPSDTGMTPFSGQFWRSPDIWIRNQDDGGTIHQNPEFGQDNYFYARVRNRSSFSSKLFGVSFTVKTFAGTQFIYPGDWRPYMGVAVADGVSGNAERIVSARWPSASVPPAGTHGCLLAEVYTPDDPTTVSSHVWEHNNLAQRNLTIVDLIPGDTALIPIRLGSSFARQVRSHRLELIRSPHANALQVGLTHSRERFLENLVNNRPPIKLRPNHRNRTPSKKLNILESTVIGLSENKQENLRLHLRPGSRINLIRDADPIQHDQFINPKIQRTQNGAAVFFERRKISSLALRLPAGRPVHVPLRVTAPHTSKSGEIHNLDFIERDRTGRIIGGIGVQIQIK